MFRYRQGSGGLDACPCSFPAAQPGPLQSVQSILQQVIGEAALQIGMFGYAVEMGGFKPTAVFAVLITEHGLNALDSSLFLLD